MLGTAALLGYALMAIAQTTNELAGTGGSAGPLPTTAAGYWAMGIAVVTPLIVTGIYKLVPRIPKILLPCSTPVIGILLGFGVNWLAQQNLGWVDMAQAGALAVFLREVFTNAVTKQVSRSEVPASPPPAAP